MAALNIMIGFPGSGKSSYAKKYLLTNNSVYLSSDDIRVELYGFEDQTHNTEVFERMKRETLIALQNDFDVVYDATNLSKKRRSDIIKSAKMCDAEVNAYLCCTPINIILERNLTRQERQIPWDKLIQMIQSIEPPMYYEGFDNIYLIDGGMYNDVYDYNNLLEKYKDYYQFNPYHNETLSEHMIAVAKKAEELGANLKNDVDRNILWQAARYHDISKPYTKQFNCKKGYNTYYGHEKVSTYMYMCHVRKQQIIDELNRVRLSDSSYQIGALILNHMEWYRREDMTPIKEMFNDDDLYYMLELLHEADIWGRNENACQLNELEEKYDIC